jgi:hypothetical protein
MMGTSQLSGFILVVGDALNLRIMIFRNCRYAVNDLARRKIGEVWYTESTRAVAADIL